MIDRLLRGYNCEVKYSSQYYNLGDDVFNGFTIEGVNKNDYDMLMLSQIKNQQTERYMTQKDIKKIFQDI